MKVKINNRNRKVSLRSRKAAHRFVLKKEVRTNPRREGTHGHHSFEVVKNGMTYEEYIACGGRNRDLAWDVEHGYIRLEPVSDKGGKSHAH